METENNGFEKKYKAFISYSHSDNRDEGRKWADWLHHMLETYEVPEDLVGQKNQAGEEIPSHIFPVFQDEKELAASSSLNHSLKAALNRSEFLIYLSSPKSANSQYVREELRYFKQLGRSNKMIALILSGEPEYGADSSSNQCFPDELRYNVNTDGAILKDEPEEVLAADVRLPGTMEQGFTSAEGYRRALEQNGTPHNQIKEKTEAYKNRLDLAQLKIISGILGVPLGELTKRDKAYQLEKIKQKNRNIKRVASVIGLLAIAAVIAGIVAWNQKNKAQANLSRSLYSSGINKLTESEFGDGAAYIAAAARNGDNNAALFAQSMLAVQEKLTLMPNISSITGQFSPDGDWLGVFANTGVKQVLQIWNAPAQKLYKQIDSVSPVQPSKPWFDNQQRLYTFNGYYNLVRYDIKKEQLETLRPNSDSMFLGIIGLSPDGKYMALRTNNNGITLFNTETRQEKTMAEKAPLGDYRSVYFSNNGQTMIITTTASESKTMDIKIFVASTGFDKPVKILSLENGPARVVINKDGSEFLFRSVKGLYYYDLKTGTGWQQDWGNHYIDYVNFNPDGKTLIAGEEGKIITIEKSTGNKLNTQELIPENYSTKTLLEILKDDPEESRALSPDRTQELLTLSRQSFIKTLWSKPLLLAEYAMPKEMNGIYPANDGKRAFFVLKGNRTIGTLDLETGMQKDKFIMLPEPVQTFTVLDKSNYLVVKTASDRIFSYDQTTGKEVGEGVKTAAKALLFDNQQQKFLARTSPNGFGIWDIKTGKKVGGYQQKPPLEGFIVDPLFKSILVPGKNDYKIMDIADSKILKQGKGEVSAAKYDPNGKYLVMTFSNGNTEVLSTNNYKLEFKLKTISNPIVVFNHKGDVAAISEDATHVRLWNLENKKVFGQTIKISQASTYFTFSNDDSRIFVQGDAGLSLEARIIDATTGNMLTMPFAQGRFDAVYVVPGNQKIITKERMDNGYTINVWEVPGQLKVANDQIADDLEKYFGKKYDPATGAVNASYSTSKNFGTWYFQDIYTRSVTPGSTTSVIDVIKKRAKVENRDDIRALSQTFGYHPLARAVLAVYFSQKPETGYIAERYIAITRPQLKKISNNNLRTEVESMLNKAKNNIKGI